MEIKEEMKMKKLFYGDEIFVEIIEDAGGSVENSQSVQSLSVRKFGGLYLLMVVLELGMKHIYNL